VPYPGDRQGIGGGAPKDTGRCPRLPPENPYQALTISDKHRPAMDGVRPAQCHIKTKDDKLKIVTFGTKRSPESDRSYGPN